jgi:hypothetical protein
MNRSKQILKNTLKKEENLVEITLLVKELSGVLKNKNSVKDSHANYLQKKYK